MGIDINKKASSYLSSISFAKYCKENLVENVKSFHPYDDVGDVFLESGFIKSVGSGALDVVKLFLTDDIMMSRINPGDKDNLALKTACTNNKLPVIRYLLEGPCRDLVNIHASEDYVFKVSVDMKNMEIINYLIFDYKIKITDDISDFFDRKKMHSDFVESKIVEIKALIKARDCKMELGKMKELILIDNENNGVKLKKTRL